MVETEVGCDRVLEARQLGRVTAEQVEHVLCCADRALDAPQRVAREQLVEAQEADEQLVGDGGEPLAQCGGLRGDVVRAAGHRLRVVLGGTAGQPCQHGECLVPNQQQRLPDLQLLDVLGQVAAGHALVDLLVPGECGELVDARLHVVPGDPLAGRDAVEVDRVVTSIDDALVGVDRSVGHRDTEFGLGAQHGQPELPFEHDLVHR